VTSNWITLKIQPPMTVDEAPQNDRYDLMAPGGTTL